MKPYYEGGGAVLYLGDARVLSAEHPPVDVVLTDPVWPTFEHRELREGENRRRPEPLAGAEDPAGLFAAVAQHFPRLAGRVVVQLGCDTDPRMLATMPAALPFVRTCWLRFQVPRYRGPILQGADVAYVFGHSRLNGVRGARVLPGECNGKYAPGACGDVRFEHPCPRNIGHVEWLVANFSRPGDCILDPFTGSGTTLGAAIVHGRRAVGFEVEEKWAEVAARHLEVVQRQGRLFSQIREVP